MTMTAVFQNIPIEGLCTKVTSGSTPLRSRHDYYVGGTIDWYKTGELNDWYLSPADERITKRALEETSVKLFPGKTVLMAMYGDGKTITSLGMLREPAATNQACAAMLVDEAKCDTHYFFYALKARRHVLLKLAYGGAQRNLTGKLIREFPLPIPPLRVQRRIAGILSAYDELIENNQRRIRILEEMARALYREWFVSFRYPDHESIPLVHSLLGSIPQGWEVVAFTELADILSGGTPKTHVSEYWNGTIPFFTPRDALACFYVQDTEKHITDLGLSKCASELYAPNTVFITARGTVGKVVLPSVPMAMNQSCYALRGKTGIPQHFLFLMTLEQVNYLKTNTGGATFDTIVVDTFRRMPIVKPPLDLIARFAHLTHAVFEAIDNLQRKNTNLRSTRDLLLPKLISGEINVSRHGGKAELIEEQEMVV
jgi:type I restriction enzyme S subunit